MNICKNGGRKFGMDLIIPNEIWKKIKPKGKPIGAGLLSSLHIVLNLEKIKKYSAWELIPR